MKKAISNKPFWQFSFIIFTLMPDGHIDLNIVSKSMQSAVGLNESVKACRQWAPLHEQITIYITIQKYIYPSVTSVIY